MGDADCDLLSGREDDVNGFSSPPKPPNHPLAARRTAGAALLFCAVATGCAASPKPAAGLVSQVAAGPQDVVVHYGGPIPSLDRVEHVVKFPGRLLRLGKEEESPSQATVGRTAGYLEEHGVSDVKIAVHDYDPSGEWRRLRENRSMSAGWKYTFGTGAWLSDTLFPRRVWGGDRYNPYTRTLHLNSNELALTLHQAAYAKNLKAGGAPGFQAAAGNLPLASFWKEWKNTSEVVRYAQAQRDWEIEQQAYRRLYPRVGSEMATTALPLTPISSPFVKPLFGLGGSLVGYAAGRRVESLRKAELKAQGTLPPQTSDASSPAMVVSAEPPQYQDSFQFQPQFPDLNPFPHAAAAAAPPATEPTIHLTNGGTPYAPPAAEEEGRPLR